MAASVTLTTLLAAVRINLSEATANFWLDPDLTQFINRARRRIEQRMLAEDPTLLEDTDDISLVAGTQEYALPTGYQFTVRVERVDITPLRPLQLAEVNFSDARTSAPGLRYYFIGHKIGFVFSDGEGPKASISNAIKHHHVALSAHLTGSGDLAPFLLAFEDAIECLATKYALIKEASPESRALAQEYQNMSDSAFVAALVATTRRSRQETEQIRDIDWTGP